MGAGPGAAAPVLSCSAGVRPPPVLPGSEEAAGAAARRAEHPSLLRKGSPAVRTQRVSTLPARAQVQSLVRDPRSCELHATPLPQREKEAEGRARPSSEAVEGVNGSPHCVQRPTCSLVSPLGTLTF